MLLKIINILNLAISNCRSTITTFFSIDSTEIVRTNMSATSFAEMISILAITHTKWNLILLIYINMLLNIHIHF